MNKRVVNTNLTIICDVVIDDLIKKYAEEECLLELTDQQLAERILFAFLNPKIQVFNEEGEVNGCWDIVCDFDDKTQNFHLVANEN